jgi:hypothetical protein
MAMIGSSRLYLKRMRILIFRETALIRVVENKQVEVVKLLFDRKASTDIQGPDDHTALYLAIRYNAVRPSGPWISVLAFRSNSFTTSTFLFSTALIKAVSLSLI